MAPVPLLRRASLASFVACAIALAATPAAAEDLPAPPRLTAAPSGAPGYDEPLAPPEGNPQDHAHVDNSPAAHDGHPLAGYHNGLFFLRDHHDNFHLYVQGRGQVDFYSYAGAGVSDTPLKPTLFLRRVRPEVTGEFLGRWRFMIAGDFGATAIDNARGRDEAAAAQPGAAPNATSARFNQAETIRFTAAATDVFVNHRASPLFNVQIGQFDAPFTMENRTSDKYIPFMERSLAVRAVGVPTNKELGAMFWGETESRFWFWSVGAFNGDGQNRPNVDARADAFGRTFIHPLATSDVKGSIRDMQVGGSFHYGSRDKNWVAYDYLPMTTQGAHPFWTPTFAGARGLTHVIPAGDQIGLAGELRIPIDRFDVASELVYVSNGTREALDGFTASNSERFGRMRGVAYYVELAYWPVGRRDINGVPGYENPPRLDWNRTDPVVPDQALQLLAKWEQVSLTYQGSSRGGTPDVRNIDGDILVDALSFGANYWATRHVRLSLNYVIDVFPGSAPFRASAPGRPEQTSRNRAVAPANTLAPGVNDAARDSSHSLHEILARIAVAL